MLPRYQVLLITLANILLPLSCVIFAVGFFPYKPVLPGLAQYYTNEHGQPPTPPFDKVIFMVVDALRSDFVYSASSGFSFVQSLITKSQALPFTAHASAPTVTMPRVKAMTTGSIPSFLDMILNFAESDTTSSLANQDTWLAQMKAKNTGVSIMYGDDTWLKLFPETFQRADGTSSFFVSDFTEVDNNVTRHIPDELKARDWSVMVMHYLGMDHIGHKTGPQSVHMLPKQREMDHIVELIWSSMLSEAHLQSTLLVLCGDHGMNEGGNHGGSAPGETSPALIFLSPKFAAISGDLTAPVEAVEEFNYYHTVEQSDLAPTLAGLLGFPVPRNNLGVFIEQFLPLWSSASDQLQLVIQNSLQMADIAKATFGSDLFEQPNATSFCVPSKKHSQPLSCSFETAVRSLINVKDSDTDRRSSIRTHFQFLREAQTILSGMASNYNVTMLHLGIFAALCALLLSGSSTYNVLRQANPLDILLVVVGLVTYFLMMFASSYVEEEHQFWFWLLPAWFSLSQFPHKYIILAGLRLCRSWNQSGQKYAGSPDFGNTVLSVNPSLLWSMIGWSVLALFENLSDITFQQLGQWYSKLISGIMCFTLILFKLLFTMYDSPSQLGMLANTVQIFSMYAPGLATLVHLMFASVLGSIIYIIYSHFRKPAQSKTSAPTTFAPKLLPLLAYFLSLQSRVPNMPLFLLFSALFRYMQRARHGNQFELTARFATIGLLASHASFFAFGETNSISSIDLSNAYNGVTSYNALAVGILLFFSNWAGPIYWSVATSVLLFTSFAAGDKPDNLRQNCLQRYKNHISLLTLWMSMETIAVMISCTVLRTHLFVWTVFSPKFLYMTAWLLGWHIMCNILIGGILLVMEII